METQSFDLFTKTGVSMPIKPTKKCEHLHVVLATSAPGNMDLRNRLRDQLRGKAFLVFLLGKTGSMEAEKLLQEESRMKGDILQGDFIDSYRNLAYKTVMGFIWVNR